MDTFYLFIILRIALRGSLSLLYPFYMEGSFTGETTEETEWQRSRGHIGAGG